MRPAVLLVDDDEDLREALCELFTALDAPCLGLGSADELMALGERALEIRLALLDVNLGPHRPSGIDAYEWLKSRGFPGRIVFLTGHARSHPAVARAYELGVRVLEKPISVARLEELLVDRSPAEPIGPGY